MKKTIIAIIVILLFIGFALLFIYNDNSEPSSSQSNEYLTCYNECLSSKGYPSETDFSSSGSAGINELECGYQCEKYRVVN